MNVRSSQHLPRRRPLARLARWLAAALLCPQSTNVAWAQDPPAPPSLRLTVTNGVQRLELAPVPAIDEYKVQSTSDLGTDFADDLLGRLSGYVWTESAPAPHSFYRLRVTGVSSNTLLGSIALNRIAYGPTPDELQRVLTGAKAMGPQAYLEEQLAPELVTEDLDNLPARLDWRFITVTGVASSSTLYLYLSAPGEVYLDDLVLVAGSVPEAGTNLVSNGGFETPLTGPWTISTNLTGSALSTDIKHRGNSGLRLVATSGGSSRDSSVWQTLTPALKVGQTYTLSYWYLPNTDNNYLTARLSGSGSYDKKLDTTHLLMPGEFLAGSIYAKLANGVASLTDLRAWLVLHAVRAKRQFLEVLTQFVDNHFTTQYSKSREFVNGLITNQTTIARVAVDFEFRELSQWRQVLLDPNGTFYDLLRISAMSPAMIIYLDTVTSSGTSPNENYSRELLELFTMGVDNGYDQTDIEQLSRAWTGWRVDKLPPGQETNPFAAPVTNREIDPGLWTLRFRTDRHDTNSKTIFLGKTVSTRFGPRYAGHSYQLALPARNGTAGMQDGYDVIKHLADLPHTQEFISVKLCRLLVHENFAHGVYDYSDAAHLSPEGRLIYDCMVAWDTPAADGRKGNLRQVLWAILNSDLFRQHAASQQKVKTPLEFVVSTVRALRAAKPEGGYTADTDGYDTLATLGRLNMNLFNRAEPDGWSEYGRDWVSTAALVERMRYAQNFLIAPLDALKAVDFGTTGKDNVSDPVALVKLRVPAAQWRDPGAVADYFLGILFPGEGRANLDLDRTNALDFLNSNDAGAPGSSPFAALDPDSAAYDGRVRGLVSLLLGLPRFQEQ